MTQNPFDALGGGGFDMNALLQQAQQMQQQLEEAQADTLASSALGPLSGGMSGLGGPGPDAGPGALGLSEGDAT